MESAGIPEPGGSGNPANLFKSSPFLAPQSSNGSKTQDQSCVLKSSRLLPLLWHWRKCNGSALTSSYNKPSTFRKFIPLTAVCLRLPWQNPLLNTAIIWVKLKYFSALLCYREQERLRCHQRSRLLNQQENSLEKMCPADPSSEPHFQLQRNVKNPLDPHWSELREKHLSPRSHQFDLRASHASPIPKNRLSVHHLRALVHPSPPGDSLSPGGAFPDASERFKTTKETKRKTIIHNISGQLWAPSWAELWRNLNAAPPTKPRGRKSVPRGLMNIPCPWSSSLGSS